jgi:hypothetical protein
MDNLESLNFPWVIQLARADAGALGELRCLAGIEVAEVKADLWLRGKACDDALNTRLASLPSRARYELLDSSQLRKRGARVPSERLPDASWQPLSSWLKVEAPASALFADAPDPISLRLVRSANEQEAELILTSLDLFARFAAQAPLIRLKRLQFAAAADGRVLVWGRPLPPLPGKQYILNQGLAVPVGFAWQPPVSIEVLTRRFVVSGDALVIWNEDNTITRFHPEQFVAATRSAIRATESAIGIPK